MEVKPLPLSWRPGIQVHGQLHSSKFGATILTTKCRGHFQYHYMFPFFNKADKSAKKEKTDMINIYKALFHSDDKDLGRDV